MMMYQHEPESGVAEDGVRVQDPRGPTTTNIEPIILNTINMTNWPSDEPIILKPTWYDQVSNQLFWNQHSLTK